MAHVGKWSDSTLHPKFEETGGGGDCFFSSIAQGLQILCHATVNKQDVRDELASSINAVNVRKFIRAVRSDHKQFTPNQAVDFNTIRFSNKVNACVHQVRKIVRTPGTLFQGTDVCAKHLTRYSKFFVGGIGMVMMNSYGPGFTEIDPDWNQIKFDRYLVLYCSANAHWKLAHVQIEGTYKSTLDCDQVKRIFTDL
jgi:hypothetical protein